MQLPGNKWPLRKIVWQDDFKVWCDSFVVAVDGEFDWLQMSSEGATGCQFSQVGSLAQIINVKSGFFYNHTIKVCDSYSWPCPGTSAPSALRLIVSLYLCSSGSTQQVEGHWWAPCHIPSQTHNMTVSLYLWISESNARGVSRFLDRDEEVSGRSGREKYFPNWFTERK